MTELLNFDVTLHELKNLGDCQAAKDILDLLYQYCLVNHQKSLKKAGTISVGIDNNGHLQFNFTTRFPFQYNDESTIEQENKC